MDGFLYVVRRLVAARALGELWVDGSFLTEKIDPDDVDMVLRIDADLCKNAPVETLQALDWFASDDLETAHRCHCFVCVEFPSDHEHFLIGERTRQYWLDWFGTSRNGEAKGIAAITVTSGVV